ncbi:hypothetical protein ACFO26_06925 [Lactococcus nasutitermitis]|uniref:Phage protein n=1 Tax=Lactococcus nasutitermitis TaxID=1652957 RepID=A0ABV9JGM9_9LACT|nr:hypothetical protein [Lactococcus nasutitermitis]
MTDAETWATNNLPSFKQRMRISTEDSDETANLMTMLTASYSSILRLVGVEDATDFEMQELIFERTRYTYNDALDEFLHNYQENIRNVWLFHHLEDEKQESEENKENSS